jgi:putative transposase
LYKTGLIRQRGPRRRIDNVGLATTRERAGWFDPRRLFQPIGEVPPAQYQMAYYRQQDKSAMAA